MAASTPWCAVALAATVVASAPARASTSQAAPWLPFHAGTDSERHEDDFWDDLHSPRLKPGETRAEGLHKDFAPPAPGAEPPVYDDFVRRWTCASDYVVLGTPTTSKDDSPLQLFAQFILFLKTIRTTSSYRLAGPALTAARTTVALRGNYRAPPELLNGSKATSEALADIKSAASKCPGQRGG